MKKRYFQKALVLFELFRSRPLSKKDLTQAEQRADSLGDYASDFRLLLAMVKDASKGKFKLKTWNLSIIVGTIIYVVSPLDAVPDMIPMLGWLDDASIVGYALTKLASELERYRAFQSENEGLLQH